MNKVILMGRLTRDPEVRYSQNDSSLSIARFTLAVDRRFKRDNEATADFISCVAFGKTAEFFAKYIKQGTKVCLEGRIQTGSYVKQDGTKVYTTDVIVENAEFAESKSASGGQQPVQAQPPRQESQPRQYQSQQYQSQQYQPQQEQPQPAYDDRMKNEVPAYQDNSRQDFLEPPAPGQGAESEGFMDIPDALEDEGLPFD